MIVDRSRNEKQQDLRLSTNLTRVFVLYITLPNVQNEDPLKIVLKSLQNGSNVQNEDPFKIVLKSLQNGSNLIVDRSRNEKQQDLRLSTNLTRAFVLYITLPNVQNEDPLKIVLKSLQNGSNVIVDRSRNEKQQDLRLSTNLTRVFVLYITLPNVQNEDPFKIVLKSLQNGSNLIVDRSRNEKQQDLRLSTNLTRAFVLYITLPNVQNEDPLKIVLKSLQNGSNVIVDRSRNEKQQDLRLSTNLTRVFVLYITLPNVQNEDPFKIVLKSLQNGSNLIVDRSRNEKQQDLRLSTNLTRAFVLYITLPNVQNEDPPPPQNRLEITSKWLERDLIVL